MGLSKTDICNQALLKVGADVIESLDTDVNSEEGTVESALLCNVFFDQALDEILRLYQWNCCTKRHTPVKLTEDPDCRAICGISSGGICAFTVAWQRPDAFRKVLSHVGSFTNIRGGHVYPALIRSTPNKPIRVFLQDGDKGPGTTGDPLPRALGPGATEGPGPGPAA